jgi:natural product biosynthesis luciferase-like monooxygenase protein/amino acid adenylation domain-containing protein
LDVALEKTGAAISQRIVMGDNRDQPSPVRPVLEIIRERAAQAPDAIAVVCGPHSLSYGALDRQAQALASRLRALEIGPDDRVAIYAPRSVDTVAGIVGILAAGAAYVPLDPEYPADLLRFMLQDSGAAATIVPDLQKSPQLSAAGPALSLADALASDLSPTAAEIADPAPDHLAYVIYTSGSTGQPKGVMVTHRNLAHSTRARFDYYEKAPARFLLLSSFAFDSSVAGLFWTLCSGGTLVLPAVGEERDPAALAALIADQRITHTLCLPSLHALLLGTSAALDSLETVIIAGESCPPELPARHALRLPNAQLFNEYGPTEATVWSTVARLVASAPITIGQPIAGTRIHLLDEAGNAVADGEPGEIHIGGAGVARGYLNQPDLTAAKFLPDPSGAPGAKLYKTGDLARMLPSGDLEFLGRLDHQVKIRGYRIEPDAIAAVLQTHPAVRAAVVLARTDEPGHPRLVAYVTPGDCPVAALSQLVSEKLPAFMVPSAFVTLDAFPLKPNGKVDRAALPAPSHERPELASTYVAPRTPLEQFLAEEWRAVLRLDRVGIDDKFLELGGDSLRAATLANRLQQKLGEPVFVVALFEAPTVAALATYLEKHYRSAVARTFGETADRPGTHASTITAATLARVRSVLPTLRNATSPARGAKNSRAIFVLAPPRSGTTLLRAMLAGHPGLFTTSELRLLGFATLAERHNAGSSQVWRRGLIETVMAAKPCDATTAEQIVADAERRNLSTAEFFAHLQQWIAPREIVDKSPSYALDPTALAQAESIFEDAFYIHLSRHPYEMVRSFEARRMDRVYLPQCSDLTPREAGEAVWLISHENIAGFLSTIPAARQHAIRFADLVREPRATMEALCDALGLPFDPALLDPYKHSTAQIPAGLHTSDDPRFHEHAKIKPEIAEGWRAAATDNFLSDLSWQLAERLGYENPTTLRSIAPISRPANDDAIAIIGMSGRFPGARDIESFWKNLCDGVESIRPFTADELRASGIDPAILAQPDYVNAGAVLDDADRFAASFFGYTPREAELMDPQQRVFLECAWEAFEHAGQDVARFPGAIGVYAGVALNSYFQNNLATRPELAPLLGQYPLTIGNEKDFVATRVAHKLDLRGPAIGVQTACSSSLVALHLACQSLRAGEIGMALVGGGRIRVPLHAGYQYIDGGIPSPDGHCRAFDAQARGCVAASGIATVVLKRLADAQRDGDHIYGVVKATAINNDGAAKAGFTAPGIEGQAKVIARTHAAAGVPSDTIGYVEAHGTGTSVGDPIEITALTRAFRATSDKTGHCRIGSVKSNIGHLDAGAGVAGLIKTALALDCGLIPPSLHFETPNPQIDFARSPFVVNAALTAWPRGASPRRAGVSSFGIGGTNAHALLEEAPPSHSSHPSRSSHLLVLSAKTELALDRATENLARHLREHPDLPLADVAHTLQIGRREFQHRRILVARNTLDAADALESRDPRRIFTAQAADHAPSIVFLFPGQGAQHPGMLRELFESEPVFREALNRCADLLHPHLDLLAALYPAEPSAEAMTQTSIAQPAIFAVEYALAKLWESWGVSPAAMVGHSVGEFTAACLAGVFTLEDALALLGARARLMQDLPGGSMLAVRLSEADLHPHLGNGIELAAINSPRLCVVSGPPEAVAAFAKKMAAQEIPCAPLQTSHAFHSAMVEPVIEPFTALARQTRFQPARIPIHSTLTGGAADLAAPEYWARQVREPVRFASTVAALDQSHVLLEVGPGTTLAPLARQSRGGTVIASQHAPGDRQQHAMLEALGRLWLAGVPIDWSRLRSGERRLRVALPTYPFERERYWIDPAIPAQPAPATDRETTPSIAPSPVAASEPSCADTVAAIQSVLHELSGVPVERMRSSATLLEIGFDSLFLTQAILALQKRFGVKVAFRQLFEELATIDALAAFIESRAPQTGPKAPASAPAPAAAQKSFGPFRPIDRSDAPALSPRQRQHLDALTARYAARTAASKRLTEEHRPHFADPRSVSGFRKFWKEMVYPIVVERSSGSKLWDVDGREYIDFTMGYGTNLLGHSPKFVTEAIAAQLERGIEIGPQSPLAGEVARLLCEFSGMDRAAFCNTGSEAVLAAVRVARTVTGRARIATCSGYHGINDEFLVRAKAIDGERRSVAIAPGIPDHVAREVLAVDYGAPESLEILRAHAHELAAVLVEPVQSRNPDLQPRAFLHELRKITREAGVALVFDEVITGFRCHPGGAQAWFDVRADLVTYGKIIGGGMPIGALCGKAAYLDALDGGAWNFGDDSRPEAGVTFFAGTYVRHPLAMAASRAVLTHLKAEGGALPQQLNERTARLVAELNSFLRENAAPIHIESFGSMFIIKFAADFAHGALLFFHLREKGIHAWDNRLLFLSTAHTEEDLAAFVRAFRESLIEMQAGGFLPAQDAAIEIANVAENIEPPAPPVAAKAAQQQVPATIPTVSIDDEEPARPLQFSLYFFGNYPAAYRDDKYDLIIESTRFADQHGFTAVWLPERHFHSVGGFSPNAAVMAAALARETSHLQLRAGSVVLPLHHPVRVAEEWSLVDNLSHGRVGISIASGWHPNDFVFAPDAYEQRRELWPQSLETIRQLWRGNAINVRAGAGENIDVKLFPAPVQRELPVWLTCVQAESYTRAGELGLNVLAQLQNQTIEEVAAKIRLYHEARARSGHDRGQVTMLLHTFLDDDAAQARAMTRVPLREYLRSHVEISQRKLASRGDAGGVSNEDLDFLLERAVDDYARGKAFIGTPESCAEVAEQLRAIGVDEVGCLIDFGVDPQAVLASLPKLDELRQRLALPGSREPVTLPLTDAQRGLHMISTISAEASRAYNESSALELRGPLDVAALRAALQAVVNRHEALRTTIDPDGESQTVRPHAPVDVPLIECESEDDLARCLAEVRALRFDFSRAPIMDARILRRAADHHILLLTFHHVLGNGPSYTALFDDLCALYTAQPVGPAMQLGDFIRWRTAQETTVAAAFWRHQFADPAPPLELSLDRPRPAIQTYRGRRETLRLERDFVATLRHAGAAHGGSLFMTLLSALQTLLHRLSGQNDVVVGVPFEGAVRGLPGGDRLIANTTNVAPLRSRVSTGTTFAELLAANRTLVLETNEHQNYFFGDLIAALKLPFDPARSPLFSVFFNYESGDYHREVGGLTVDLVTDSEPFLALRDTAMFELYLNVAERDGALVFRCDYNRDLFDAATVRRWLGHLHTLLAGIVADTAQPIAQVPLLTPEERAQLISGWNQTALDFPRDTTLPQLVADTARRTPDACAVIDGDARLTYRELDRRAQAIAARLRALGIRPEAFVGVCMGRSADMLAAVLGVLQAGGAYVPMDPDFPHERLALMLEDSRAAIVLCDAETAASHGSRLPAALWEDVALIATGDVTRFECDARAEDAAYLIYTSGSTGRPKGVEIPHRALTNFLTSMQTRPGITAADTLLAVTTLSFDIAGLELFLPLVAGARVVIASRDTALDPTLLAAELSRHAVTILQATPATWRGLLDSGWRGAPGLKALIGGEALPANLAAELLPRIGELWNMYGPTETTIWSTIERITSAQPPISIGRPIANTTIYIVDANRQPVPIGVPGELLIGGAGLARGYFGRPELTAEKFIAHPFDGTEGARVYRTGDLARYLPDGRIECLGRIDHQVKLRGFRIELGEIEAALNNHPTISESAVVLREDGGAPRLVAYCVRQSSQANEAEAEPASNLATALRARLPEYMIPSIFMFLEKLPRTPNGKLDRRTLPAPDLAALPSHERFVAPRNDLERSLAKVWNDVLGLERVGVHDNFFDVGGHSLSAIRVVTRVQQELHADFSLRIFFTKPTIAEIAAHLAPEGKMEPGNPPIQPRTPHRLNGSSIVLPENALQFELLQIWEKLLGREPISITDNFFDLAGHELLAVEMLGEVGTRVGVTISMATFVAGPTIQQLAKDVGDAQTGDLPDPSLLPMHTDGDRAPLFFFHGHVYGGVYFCRALAEEFGEHRPFVAVHPHGMDGSRPPASIEEMAASHVAAIRRAQPHGPYFLGGYCNGGYVAFETARLLEAAGESVPCVVLVGADAGNICFRPFERWTRWMASWCGENDAQRHDRFMRLRHRFIFLMQWPRFLPDLRGRVTWRESFSALGGKLRTVLRHLSKRTSRSAQTAPSIQEFGFLTERPPDPLLQIYYDACEAYIPRKFGGKVVLLWPEEQPPLTPGDAAAEWRSLCHDVEVRLIPGDHRTSVTLKENMQAIALEMREIMDQEDTSSRTPVEV